MEIKGISIALPLFLWYNTFTYKTAKETYVCVPTM